MPQYLLDTNILSYLVKRSFPSLNHRFDRTAKHEFALSAISEAEIRFGLALLPPEAKQHRVAELFLNGLTVEAWDSPCAKLYASVAAQQRLRGEGLSQLDAMIAAHALARKYVLLTHDRAFFRVPGLHVQDWTQGPLPA